jgi:hypothetical protein
LGPGPDGDLKYRPLELPGTKAELEAMIVGVVTESDSYKGGKIPWPGVPVQAEENSFDFAFREKPGTFLELMEIAQFDAPGGFERAKLQRQAHKFVWGIWQKLSEKAMGYGDLSKTKVHLLLYTTDHTFHLTPWEESALSHCLEHVERGFQSVTYAHATGGATPLLPRAIPDDPGITLSRLRSIEMIGGDLPSFVKTGPNSGTVAGRARRGDPPKR